MPLPQIAEAAPFAAMQASATHACPLKIMSCASGASQETAVASRKYDG